MENDNTKQKDTAKEKIILFIIGVLVGAVVSTAAFFVYVKTLGASSNTSSTSQQMPGGGTPPEMPSGQNNQSGTPPEMPSGQNDQSGTPPEKPSDDSNSQSNN